SSRKRLKNQPKNVQLRKHQQRSLQPKSRKNRLQLKSPKPKNLKQKNLQRNLQPKNLLLKKHQLMKKSLQQIKMDRKLKRKHQPQKQKDR
ncbi:MAG: hypothetical protein HQ558_02865, partial [Candidatus Omnitrophica bacterium]|nr:hypothetical protein [Candidatus Omnitrophota bacterium]